MSTLSVSGSPAMSYASTLSSQNLASSFAAATAATSNTASTNAATAASSVSSSSLSTSGLSTSGSQVHGHHRHHGGGGKMKELQSSVTDALQQAQEDGTDTDPNDVVENAIAKVFQGFVSGSSSSATPGTMQPEDADGTDPSASAGGTQSFEQTLQSAGIDPQQFQQDFLSAVQDAQNGNVNPATAFANAPVGSIVDEFA